MTQPETLAEPLYTGRPRLTAVMTTAALVLYGVAFITVAVAAAAPSLVPKLWIWIIVGGTFALGGIAMIVAMNVRPQLTAAGRLANINAGIAALTNERDALTGAAGRDQMAAAGRGLIGFTDDELAALAASYTGRPKQREPGSKPRPRRSPASV